MNTFRKIYLYLFSVIGLVLIVIAAVQIVNLGLKTFIFKGADQYIVYPAVKMAPSITEKDVVVAEPTEEELRAFNEKQKNQERQRTAADSLAMLIVGIPLYFYHWNLIKNDK